MLSTTTWNAYNDWGGPSFYTGSTRVSFERPMARGFLVKPEPSRRIMQPEPDREAMWYRNWARPLGLSDWSGGAGWWNWERPFTRWAESDGFRVDVAISQDLEQHPEVLDHPRLFVSAGHDEYWSWGMRDALDAFVAQGGNAAIFSGNTCFWQIRYEDDHRAMTSYKYRADEDPVLGTADEHLLTGPWSDRRIGRPETSTTGLTFTRGGYSRYGLGAAESSGAYTVHRPEHWVFEGTELKTESSSGAQTRSSRTSAMGARSSSTMPADRSRAAWTALRRTWRSSRSLPPTSGPGTSSPLATPPSWASSSVHPWPSSATRTRRTWPTSPTATPCSRRSRGGARS